MTWWQISDEAMIAAKALSLDGRWRSSVSRAYYAAYASVAGGLQGRASFPAGRHGPTHDRLPVLIMTYMTSLPVWNRRQVAGTARRLYEWRVAADYIPTRLVDRAVTRACLQDAAGILRMVTR